MNCSPTWTWWRKKRSGSATAWIYPNACMIFAKAVGWQSAHKIKNVSHRSTTNYVGSNWQNIFCIILILMMLRWVYLFSIVYFPFYHFVYFLSYNSSLFYDLDSCQFCFSSHSIHFCWITNITSLANSANVSNDHTKIISYSNLIYKDLCLPVATSLYRIVFSILNLCSRQKHWNICCWLYSVK